MSDSNISDLLDPPRRNRKGAPRAPWDATPASAIKTLVDRLGGPAKAAGVIGVTRQSVYLWGRQGYVNPERALDLEERFGAERWSLMHPNQARIFKA